MKFKTKVKIYYFLAYGGTVPIFICAHLAIVLEFYYSLLFLLAGILCWLTLAVFDRVAMRCPYCRQHIRKPRDHQLCPHCGKDLYLETK